MKHDATKFIGFFNLMEAMKKAGCPVCIRILEETHRFMNSFLCESVNDARLRDEICRDRGCAIAIAGSWHFVEKHWVDRLFFGKFLNPPYPTSVLPARRFHCPGNQSRVMSAENHVSSVVWNGSLTML